MVDDHANFDLGKLVLRPQQNWAVAIGLDPFPEYKAGARYRLDDAGFFVCDLRFRWINKTDFGNGPVSYTHLDVYKRQMQRYRDAGTGSRYDLFGC